MMPKKQTYKNTQGGKEKESLQKGCLKINEAEKKSREPEVVALQNDTQKCYLKSQFIIKKGHRVGYNIHIMKKNVTLQNDDGFRVECGC